MLLPEEKSNGNDILIIFYINTLKSKHMNVFNFNEDSVLIDSYNKRMRGYSSEVAKQAFQDMLEDSEIKTILTEDMVLIQEY
jgi:hypothetical protein